MEMKDIIFISVGCVHVGYTAWKIYQAFSGGFQSEPTSMAYNRNICESEEVKIPNYIEYDQKFETNTDYDASNESGANTTDCSLGSPQLMDQNPIEIMHEQQIETKLSKDSAFPVPLSLSSSLPLFAGYIRKFFKTQTIQIPDFIEFDPNFEWIKDHALNEFGSIATTDNLGIPHPVDQNLDKQLHAGQIETKSSDASIPPTPRPPLSRRAQAIKTAMTLKSKRWLREQTRKESDYVVFSSAANYKYAKKIWN